jgi:hypothetical protein
MQSWGNRDTIYSAVIQQLLSAKAGVKPKPELPDNLTLWLAQLTLLYGVPVEYMIPDTRMLPVESMRFFYVDKNWQDRLIDGAMSVGVFSSKELIFNEAFYEDIYAQVDEMQLKLRPLLRKEPLPTLEQAGGGITGLIFRSAVVSGWPGLEVEAWSGTTLLDILRMDRLSDNVMLCMFNGLPDKVDFTEPGEGLHFGVVRDPAATNFQVYLRGLGFPNEATYPAGKQIMVNSVYLKADGTLRTGNGQEPGVIDIQGLKASITAAMPAGALQNGKLTPGGMAIQLVQGAGKQSYDLNSPECLFVPDKNEN